MLYAASVSRLQQSRREWDDLATIDPHWAILSSDEKRDGRWEDEEFLASGRAEVEALLRRADQLGVPRRRAVALDFGCGLGRVTRPLAEHFDRAVGVDISAEMVAAARRRHVDAANVEFLVNESDRLPAIATESVDIVYSRIVLQHVPSASAIRSYLAELARILRHDGLLAVQLPSHIPLKHRLQPRPRAYAALRRLGVPASTLYTTFRLHPIRMRWLATSDVRAILEAHGLRLLAIDTERVSSIESSTYYATRGDS